MTQILELEVYRGWWAVQSCVQQTVQYNADCEMASISLTIQSKTCGPSLTLGRFGIIQPPHHRYILTFLVELLNFQKMSIDFNPPFGSFQ